MLGWEWFKVKSMLLSIYSFKVISFAALRFCEIEKQQRQ